MREMMTNTTPLTGWDSWALIFLGLMIGFMLGAGAAMIWAELRDLYCGRLTQEEIEELIETQMQGEGRGL